MPLNIATTPVDNGKVEVENGEFEDTLITLTGPNKRLKSGTIVSRSVADPTKHNLFVVGGASDGNGVPSAIVTYDTVEKISAGAGDVPARVLVAGTVNFNRLVVDAAGNNSTLTNAHVDTLRGKNITCTKVAQLSG